MKLELLQHFGELNELTKGLKERIQLEAKENMAFAYFAKQDDEHLSIAILQEMLHWVNRFQDTRIYKIEVVAERLYKISHLLYRIRKGDESVIQEVAYAFIGREDKKLTKPQVTNIIAFCGLVSPDNFPLLSKGSIEIINALWEKKEFVLDGLCSVSSLVSFIKSLREAVDSIKEQWPNLSFQDINSTLQSIWVVLTDDKVVKLILDGLIYGSLTALGLPYELANLLLRLVSMGIVDVLKPSIERYHKKQLQNLKK